MSVLKKRIAEMKKLRLNFFEILIALYYTWFFMPVVNAYFSSNIFKYVFFGMFALGCCGLLITKKRAHKVPFNRVTVAIVLYFLVMSFMYIVKVGDASAHIRVSFTFWGTALLYFYVLDESGIVRLGKYFILIFLITCVTSSIGVITDNGAARTLTQASADDEMQHAYSMKNIASIYLFQGMVMLIPSLICLTNLEKKKSKRIVYTLVVIGIFVILINASFTISLLAFFVTVCLSLLFLKSKNLAAMFLKTLFCIALICVVIFGRTMIIWFANTVNSVKISDKLIELSDILYGSNSTGGSVELRIDLYRVSIETFIQNPFGIGPKYSYVQFENGIGYHSQLFDDLARYGVFAIVFYTLFLTGYYRWLKKEWADYSSELVPKVTTICYALFLALNIGFRSGAESLLVLFVIPVIPRLVSEHCKRKRF